MHEVDDEAEAPHKCLIEVTLAVGRKDRDSVELLHPLEQVVDFDIGETVVRVLDLSPLSEQRVRLIKQKHDVGTLTWVEDLFETLLGFADVLVDDARQVDPVEVHRERSRDHLRGHRLARATGTREQSGHPAPEGAQAAETPILVYLPAQACL